MIGAAFAQRLRHKQGAEVPSPFPFRERMSMNTRQTAEIMAAHLQPEEGKRQIAGLAPSDDVEPTRERVQKESGKFNDRRPSALSQPAGTRTPWGARGRDRRDFSDGGVVHLEAGKRRKEAGPMAIPPGHVPAPSPISNLPLMAPLVASVHDFKHK